MNWLHYLLEANVYLAVFYAGYCLFLNKETYYTLNRVYLLLSCVMSFLLPVIQVGALKPVEQSAGSIEIISTQSIEIQPTADTIIFDDVLIYTYLLGVIVLAVALLIKLSRLIKMMGKSKTLVDNKYKLIGIDGSNTAFSFFNYLFIGTKLKGSDTIIRHELVHIKQKHSADIIFIELIRVINWFNPIIYLLQISLKTVHEYIADEQTASLESDALTYSSFLVNNAYGIAGPSITHSFFNYNLLKKRIIMLNQKRSGNLARLKYLVAVPICAGMLCASTLAFSKNYGWVDIAPKHTALPATTKTTPTIKSANTVADTLARSRVKTKATTAKGYNYEETGYLINNKADFRVIITDKNGDQKEYYKSKAKPEELAMLKEKYGYSFPKMLIFPKMPPPPPMPPVARADTNKMPPPPPASPKSGAKKLHRLPPPPVGSVDINKMPPPPPVPPVGSADIDKMPPPPPVPPVDSKDLAAMPVPAQPVSLKRLNLKVAPVKTADITIDAPAATAQPASTKQVKKLNLKVAPVKVAKVIFDEPAPAQPVSPKQLKNLKVAPVKVVKIIFDKPKAKETPAPAVAPTDVKP